MSDTNSKKRPCEDHDEDPDCKEQDTKCDTCSLIHDDCVDCALCFKTITDCSFRTIQHRFDGPFSNVCNQCYDQLHQVTHATCADPQQRPDCLYCEIQIASDAFYRMPTAQDEEKRFLCLECGDEYNAELKKSKKRTWGKSLVPVTLSTANPCDSDDE